MLLHELSTFQLHILSSVLDHNGVGDTWRICNIDTSLGLNFSMVNFTGYE